MLNDCIMIRRIAVFTDNHASLESVQTVDLISSIDSHELFFQICVVLMLIKFRRALIRLSV